MKILLRIVFAWAVILASCHGVSAQLKIVPKERLDSVACPPLSPDAAFLHLDRITVLLGELSSEGPVSKVLLKISNSGEKELKISRITTTCSCVNALSDRMLIKPGESASLKVSFNPRGHLGYQKYRVHVYTGNDSNPAAILNIEAHVTR